MLILSFFRSIQLTSIFIITDSLVTRDTNYTRLEVRVFDMYK